jgi:hypothetical protein
MSFITSNLFLFAITTENNSLSYMILIVDLAINIFKEPARKLH